MMVRFLPASMVQMEYICFPTAILGSDVRYLTLEHLRSGREKRSLTMARTHMYSHGRAAHVFLVRMIYLFALRQCFAVTTQPLPLVFICILSDAYRTLDNTAYTCYLAHSP